MLGSRLAAVSVKTIGQAGSVLRRLHPASSRDAAEEGEKQNVENNIENNLLDSSPVESLLLQIRNREAELVTIAQTQNEFSGRLADGNSRLQVLRGQLEEAEAGIALGRLDSTGHLEAQVNEAARDVRIISAGIRKLEQQKEAINAEVKGSLLPALDNAWVDLLSSKYAETLISYLKAAIQLRVAYCEMKAVSAQGNKFLTMPAVPPAHVVDSFGRDIISPSRLASSETWGAFGGLDLLNALNSLRKEVAQKRDSFGHHKVLNVHHACNQRLESAGLTRPASNGMGCGLTPNGGSWVGFKETDEQ